MILTIDHKKFPLQENPYIAKTIIYLNEEGERASFNEVFGNAKQTLDKKLKDYQVTKFELIK